MELELQETPRLCPRHSNEDIGHLMGERYPDADHPSYVPLADKSQRGTSVGRGGTGSRNGGNLKGRKMMMAWSGISTAL